ncbi:J domain-containing protein [Arthrobacter sp. FW306-04-A]|uniref:J domain-containing protein n=1 Tax=Arthrobacter sp. FW306-04-A TaxID=2879619 RepID=UPI0037C00E3A|nr:J domain-containing protein [Arthrobacter sp. FW306-04-A]
MTSNGPDPYDVLRIAPTATPREVAHAYRALMRSRHPDTRPADDSVGLGTAPQALQELQDIMTAYAILGNPKKRAAYDRDHPHSAATEPPPQRESLARPGGRLLPAASLLIWRIRH